MSISARDLQPGDVLLYRGRTLVSLMIRLVDGTEVNHAGLYLGDEAVGEALFNGLVRQPLGASTRNQVRVHARRLVAAPADMSPVLHRATHYLDIGERYAYEQIVLLAFLCLTRRMRVNRVLRALIRTTLEAAAARLLRFAQGDRTPLICSEFVYRVHEEAVTEGSNPYTLSIRMHARAAAGSWPGVRASGGGLGSGIHPQSLLALFGSPASEAWLAEPVAVDAFAAGVPEPPIEDVEALIARYLDEVGVDAGAAAFAAPAPAGEADASMTELRLATERFAQALHAAEGGPPDDTVVAFVSEGDWSLPMQHLMRTASEFVTPGDLLKSPSLYEVGELQLEALQPAAGA